MQKLGIMTQEEIMNKTGYYFDQENEKEKFSVYIEDGKFFISTLEGEIFVKELMTVETDDSEQWKEFVKKTIKQHLIDDGYFFHKGGDLPGTIDCPKKRGVWKSVPTPLENVWVAHSWNGAILNEIEILNQI